MNSRDRIEHEHAEATHGPRHDLDDRPSRQELREDQADIDRAERNRPRSYRMVDGWSWEVVS